MTNHYRSRTGEFVFPSPFLDLPRINRNRKRRARWPGILLAFIIGLAVGWLLRDGGALLP